METSTMIRQLRRTAKKHENDKLNTFDTNVSLMCTDVANRLEELEKENKEIRNKAIDEFADKMIIMMPGHKQDILAISEKLKGGAE